MIPLVTNQLNFGPLLPRSGTNRVIIHHSASFDVPAAVIHDWHRQKGWSGLGYHAVIRADGTIEAGRPLDSIGAHAGPEANRDSIGICLTGNFMEHEPSAPQLNSLLLLLDYLDHTYGKRLVRLRHKDVAPTQCPGDLFPWPEEFWPKFLPGAGTDPSEHTPMTWKEALVSEARARKLISAYHRPEDPAPKWFVLAVGLNIMKEVDENAGG